MNRKVRHFDFPYNKLAFKKYSLENCEDCFFVVRQFEKIYVLYVII